MPKKEPSPASADPVALARALVDGYFDALASDMPFDTAPGDVNLISGAQDVAEAVRSRTRQNNPDVEADETDDALRAGYLVGVEVGRRLGGAR